MKGQITVTINTHEDLKAIKRAITDPAIVAFLIVVGVFKKLKTNKERKAVLAAINDSLKKEDNEHSE